MTSLPFLLLLAAYPETESDLKIIPSSGDERLVRVLVTLPAEQLEDLPRGSVASRLGRELLQFAVLNDTGTPGRPMLGRYMRAGNTLTFAPRFPLVPGGRYRAVFKSLTGKTHEAEYHVRVENSKREPSAVVTHVYPTASVLPANALKFYIHFSKPMRRGRAIFDRIHLLDQDGKEIPDPWRRTELWTADDRRFTLWIHPGRVKQGVNLREDFGPVLKPDGQYTLLIAAEVQDENGQPLVREYRRKFRTRAEDHEPIAVGDWLITAPREGTRGPLSIDCRESLDHALLLRCLEVHDEAGDIISGAWTTRQDDSVVTFAPSSPWRGGEVQVTVDGILEDLAGNTPLRVFDTDLTREDRRRAVLRRKVSMLAAKP